MASDVFTNLAIESVTLDLNQGDFWTRTERERSGKDGIAISDLEVGRPASRVSTPSCNSQVTTHSSYEDLLVGDHARRVPPPSLLFCSISQFPYILLPLFLSPEIILRWQIEAPRPSLSPSSLTAPRP